MKTYFSLLGLMAIVLCSCKESPVKTAKNNRLKNPNIVLILTDDQGYADLGVFGAKDFDTPIWTKWQKKGHYSPNITPLKRYAPPPGLEYSPAVTPTGLAFTMPLCQTQKRAQPL